MEQITQDYVGKAQVLIGTWRLGPVFFFAIERLSEGRKLGAVKDDPESHRVEHTATAEALADPLLSRLALNASDLLLPGASGGRKSVSIEFDRAGAPPPALWSRRLF